MSDQHEITVGDVWVIHPDYKLIYRILPVDKVVIKYVGPMYKPDWAAYGAYNVVIYVGVDGYERALEVDVFKNTFQLLSVA